MKSAIAVVAVAALGAVYFFLVVPAMTVVSDILQSVAR